MSGLGAYIESFLAADGSGWQQASPAICWPNVRGLVAD